MNTTTNETSTKSKSYTIEVEKPSGKDLDSSNSPGKRKRGEKGDISTTNLENSQTKTLEKSPSRIAEDKKQSGRDIFNLDNSNPENVSREKKNRSRSPSVSSKKMRNNKSNNLAEKNKKMKKRVNFREKNFLEVVIVESYKKYNVDMSYNEPDSEETTRCRCLIF